MRKLLILTSIICTLISCSKKEGCTDPLAINYDESADVDCCCEYLERSSEIVFSPTFYGETILPDEEYDLSFDKKIRFFTISAYFSNIRANSDIKKEVGYIDFLRANRIFDFIDQTDSNVDITFDFGLDSVTNNTNQPSMYTAEEELGAKSPSMYWSWASDYLFLRIDGEADLDNDGVFEQPITYHIGTDAFYKKDIQPLYNVEVLGNESSLRYSYYIDVDFVKVLEGIDLATENKSHTTSFPEVAEKIANNFILALEN